MKKITVVIFALGLLVLSAGALAQADMTLLI